MKKDDKAKLVEQLKEKFDRAKIVIIFHYIGATVEKINHLRRSLDKLGDLDVKVVKNTLARRAIEGTSLAGLAEDFTGPNAVLFGYGDPVAPAKTLVDLTKEIEAIQIRSGMLDGRRIGKNEVIALAKLPGREQLLAMLLGAMQAPIGGFVTLLSQVPRGLLNVLTAHKENLEKAAA